MRTIYGDLDFRVVLRDSKGKIVEDLYFETFKAAELEFHLRRVKVPEGHELAFQHGARMIEKATSEGVGT